MKRLMLTSMLTAAGLLAQSGSAPTPAPPAPAPKAQTTTKKPRHHKKSTATKDGTASSVQPNASPAPAKK